MRYGSLQQFAAHHFKKSTHQTDPMWPLTLETYSRLFSDDVNPPCAKTELFLDRGKSWLSSERKPGWNRTFFDQITPNFRLSHHLWVKIELFFIFCKIFMRMCKEVVFSRDKRWKYSLTCTCVTVLAQVETHHEKKVQKYRKYFSRCLRLTSGWDFQWSLYR